MVRHRLVAAAVTVVVAAVLTGCSGNGDPGRAALPRVPEPTRADLGGTKVLVIGDSLAMQSANELRSFARLHRYELLVEATSGATPCDGQEPLAAALREEIPDVVVVAYSGNTWLYSSCFGDRGQTIQEAAQRYHDLIGRMVTDIETAGAAAGLLGGPVWPANDLAPLVHDTVRALASDRSVPFVDGGWYVTPNRQWFAKVPCRSTEERCVNGEVEVHLATGTEVQDVHFDCDEPGWVVAHDEPCPVYSAGSYRYAHQVDQLIQETVR